MSPKFQSNQKSKLHKASKKYSVFIHAIILFGSGGVCPLLLPLCKSFKKLTFSAQSWILGFKRCLTYFAAYQQDVQHMQRFFYRMVAPILLGSMPVLSLQNGWFHQSSKTHQRHSKSIKNIQKLKHCLGSLAATLMHGEASVQKNEVFAKDLFRPQKGKTRHRQAVKLQIVHLRPKCCGREAKLPC